MVGRGRGRVRAALHAVVVWVLRLAVVGVLLLRVVAVDVDGDAVRSVVARVRVALDHPAVVSERRQVLAQPAPRVPVAAEEVGEDYEEEDGDDRVADGVAGLGGGVSLGRLEGWGVGCDLRLTTTSCSGLLDSSRRSCSRSRSRCSRRSPGYHPGAWKVRTWLLWCEGDGQQTAQ